MAHFRTHAPAMLEKCGRLEPRDGTQHKIRMTTYATNIRVIRRLGETGGERWRDDADGSRDDQCSPPPGPPAGCDPPAGTPPGPHRAPLGGRKRRAQSISGTPPGHHRNATSDHPRKITGLNEDTGPFPWVPPNINAQNFAWMSHAA